jgi:hypothetical protein
MWSRVLQRSGGGRRRRRGDNRAGTAGGGIDGELREHHRLGVKWRPKISDMGLSKQLTAGVSSFAVSGAEHRVPALDDVDEADQVCVCQSGPGGVGRQSVPTAPQ